MRVIYLVLKAIHKSCSMLDSKTWIELEIFIYAWYYMIMNGSKKFPGEGRFGGIIFFMGGGVRGLCSLTGAG